MVLAPLVAALGITVAALHAGQRAQRLALLGAAVSLAGALRAAWHCAGGAVLAYEFGGWAAPYGIVYRIDALAALLGVLIAAIGATVLVYAGPSARAELPDSEGPFFAMASLLIGALQGMAATGDLFNLYVFLEIASIAAYTLIAAGGSTASLASFRYLLLGTVGATFYLLGLAYLYALTGTLNMADMAGRLPQVGPLPSVLVAAAFIVTGLSLKMALFPMHGWLPDAYTYAPSAATALIASLMTKVNAFALLRVLYGVLWPTIGPVDLPVRPILAWLAAAGILGGSAMALAQRDLKRLLAYSSIAHLGYIGLGIALGNRDGLIGAALHIVAHALTKGCLFLIAGGVEHRLGTRTDHGLCRLAPHMPLTMAAFVIAACSMIGVPPTVGFFSKWYLLLGALEAGSPPVVFVVLLSSLLNAWYFFRLIEWIYFAPLPGPPNGVKVPGHRELPLPMLGSIACMAAAILASGILSAPLVRHFALPPVEALPVLGATAAPAPATCPRIPSRLARCAARACRRETGPSRAPGGRAT